VLPPDHPHVGLQRRNCYRAVAAGIEAPHVEFASPAALARTTPMVMEVHHGTVDEDAGCTMSLVKALGVATDGAIEPWSCPPQDEDDCSMYRPPGSVGTPRVTHFTVLIDHTYSPAIRTLHT
jgi:hypothetical protein